MTKTPHEYIRVTYEYIQVHTTDIRVHTTDIRVHTTDIRVYSRLLVTNKKWHNCIYFCLYFSGLWGNHAQLMDLTAEKVIYFHTTFICMFRLNLVSVVDLLLKFCIHYIYDTKEIWASLVRNQSDCTLAHIQPLFYTL